MGIHAIYHICLIVRYGCVFPSSLLFLMGRLARNCLPTHCPHLHCANWKGTSFAPPSPLSLQSQQWHKHSELHSDLPQSFWWVPYNRKWEGRNTRERVYKILSGGIASCPKMFPTRLALQCNDIMIQSHYNCISTEPMITSNKKVIILLIFTVVITHHFYKHGNHCCLHWRQSTVALELFFPQRQEGLCSCHQFHRVHQYFPLSSMISSQIVIHLPHMLQKGDQKGLRSREWCNVFSV